MKRVSSLLVCICLLLGLCSCGGTVKGFKTKDVDSELYSVREIKAAIEVITKEFDKEWAGCTLTEIYYAGDETASAHQDWATRYEADEVIVLVSSFDVDSSGGDGSLNPNSTYNDWQWILVREKGGKWKHVDHGY